METIFNALAEWIVITNKKGNIQFANHALLRWLRCKQQDVYHKPLEEFIYISTFNNKKYKDLKGKSLPIQVQIENQYGESLKADIILKDECWMGQEAVIMVIKELSQEVDYNGVLKEFLDSIPEGICIKDEESKYIYVNKSYTQLVNVNRKDLLGHLQKEFIQQENYELFNREDNEVLKSQKAQMFERIIRRENDRGWYQTFKAPLYNAEGKPGYVGSIISDMTLIKKIELELLSRLDELKTLEKCIEDAKEYDDDMDKFLNSLDKDILRYFNADCVTIWIYDEVEQALKLHTRVGLADEVLKNITGISVAKEILNESTYEARCGKVYHVTQREDILNSKILIENGIKYVSTYSIEHNDEILGFITMGYRNNKKDDVGKEEFARAICAQLGLIIKNSNLKKVVQKELQQIRELEKDKQMEKMKNEFFANISHEFRTPLNIILTTVQLMDKCIEDGSLYIQEKVDVDKYVQNIRQNAYRLLRLVNNLIDITCIDTGYYKLNLENHNIVEVVEDITLSVVRYMEDKDIMLVFDTEVEEKIIACDSDKIERIILNLLSNAIKNTNKEGQIKVDIKINKEKVQISIKDNGVGIPKEQLDIIFNRFIQVDDLLTRQHEGSGIGLSLVKSLVEMHGGSIQVDSELGEGTTFIIELPIKKIEGMQEESNNYSSINDRIEKCCIEFSDIYHVATNG